MDFRVLFCLVLAHFIADFPLQLKTIVKIRSSTLWGKSLWGNFLHACIHFFVSLIFLMRFWSLYTFILVFILSLLHGLVDYFKSWIILKKPFLKFNAILFLLDQTIHILLIMAVLICFNGKVLVSPSIENSLAQLVSSFNRSASAVTFNDKIVLSFVLSVIGLWGVGVFIRLIFSGMNSKRGLAAPEPELKLSNKNEGASDGGFTIGLLERIFIILSILMDMPLVIGFILTVKSVARLKKFDDDRFVEMFIIGSFISFISAISVGYLIKALLTLPY